MKLIDYIIVEVMALIINSTARYDEIAFPCLNEDNLYK